MNEMPQFSKVVVITCLRCGATFNTEDFWFGSNAHSNETSDWNLNIIYNRGEMAEHLSKLKEQERKCVLIWLEQNKGGTSAYKHNP